MHASFVKNARNAVALHAVASQDARALARKLPFLKASGFSGKEGEVRLVPGRGGLAAAVLGLGRAHDPLALAAFAEQLPDGVYRLGEVPDFCGGGQAALAWRLGLYAFDRYKKPKARHLKLVLPKGVDGEEVSRIADGVMLARDLINTPPNDMGPKELAEAARGIARAHGAKFRTVEGQVLARDYPLVAAVGQGSARAPRLIELVWGDAKAPKVTLVGKGVCFDTGGYNLKPTSGMATMKKDMGGAAVVLGLAQMVMTAKFKLRLRVLVPAVENSVSGSAYRPSDVFKSRKGLTVEIGNTDAEGRLVLADALADADAERPELLIDCATLTGAARMATGMELPPFFTDDERLAADVARIATAVADPVWRLPLWRGYETTLNSSVADLTNNPSYNLAGAITAALFLNRFVGQAESWLHIDIPGWVDRPKPGRRVGAEANGARLLYALLKERYGR
ncbi:MAG TPA: leucyl aminopeptidase family protein [Rhizomicrobium sp.]|nr:leucyl aminopeptidase family protein [Rhizomicrobium sp.]